jgi:hypothetical protein
MRVTPTKGHDVDELVDELVKKVGLTPEQGEIVVAFLQENAHKVPGWLGLDLNSVTDMLPGGLGSLFKG